MLYNCFSSSFFNFVYRSREIQLPFTMQQSYSLIINEKMAIGPDKYLSNLNLLNSIVWLWSILSFIFNSCLIWLIYGMKLLEYTWEIAWFITHSIEIFFQCGLWLNTAQMFYCLPLLFKLKNCELKKIMSYQ